MDITSTPQKDTMKIELAYISEDEIHENKPWKVFTPNNEIFKSSKFIQFKEIFKIKKIKWMQNFFFFLRRQRDWEIF